MQPTAFPPSTKVTPPVFSAPDRLQMAGGIRDLYQRFGLIFVLEGAAAFRRSLDILFAIGALFALSPLWLAILVLVARRRRPLLCRRPLIGRWCEPFEEFHFEPPPGPLGEIIRWFHLDRLPNVINLLRGDLSLIGPRPLIPEELTPAIRESRRQYDVRPGLVRLWWFKSPGFPSQTSPENHGQDGSRSAFRRDLQGMIRAFPTILYTGGALWAPDRIGLLGVGIDNLTLSEAGRAVRGFIREKVGGQIVFVTADQATIAHQDSVYREVLERSLLRLPGTRTIRLAAKILGQELRSFITPETLLRSVFSGEADSCGPTPLRLFLVGRDERNLRTFLGRLTAHSSLVECCGIAAFEDTSGPPEDLFARIRSSGANLLLADLPSPALEVWLDRAAKDLGPIVAFGLGNWLAEVIAEESGLQPPPPDSWRVLGLADIWSCWHQRSGLCPLTVLGNATLLVRVFLERAGRRSPAPRFEIPKF